MKLDNKHISEFGLIMQPGHQHTLPHTRDRFIDIPGRHGAYDFGADFGRRNFRIPLAWAKEYSRIELQKRIREFSSFLLDKEGKPRTMKLVFDYEPDKYYMVRYSGAAGIERLLALGFFSLPLTAFDPFAYADHDGPGTNPGSVQWTTSPTTSIVTNYSKYTTPLILTIEGDVSSISIKNNTTGEEMNIDYTLTEGKRLFVDSQRFLVFVGDIADEVYFVHPEYPALYKKTINEGNILSQVAGDFISLVEGENEMEFSGTSPDALIVYYWKHKFL